MYPIFTIGHSTHSIEEFIHLLKLSNINHLVDVRSLPGSRHCPQFNQEVMKPSLEESGIRYTHMIDLGGKRNKQKDVDPMINASWTCASFKNYADYTLSNQFSNALNELIKLSETDICAIMCSEAVWWKCHRRIITDHLLFKGLDVFHIIPPKTITGAKMTEFAVIDGDRITYPSKNFELF